MPKRKLDSSPEPAPVTPKRSRVPGGILKTERTPSSGHNRTVTFPPPSELADILNVVARLDGDCQVKEEEFGSLMAMLEHIRGPSLIMWLEELQVSSIITVGEK